ncbi:uncharacterized protein BDFB_009354 [Asbolus verrucosus]|uniref:Uncharacterized protein n=1 Tax=Asbolus verrucosus TaxID=1661398 RepID=A0A482VUK0_ASBVE|nr:uncharacterized protein BDFB_009354 [Asbolus verrucosus]
MSILLFNYYMSSIISSLLSKPPQSFQTLDELGHSKPETEIEDISYTITWFEIMNDSDVQYIYRNKVFPPSAKHLNIYTAEEGIAKVKDGKSAYHTQLDTGYSIIARTFDEMLYVLWSKKITVQGIVPRDLSDKLVWYTESHKYGSQKSRNVYQVQEL